MHVFTTAAAGTPNRSGRPPADRWATGVTNAGAYVIVADGISGGSYGERAASAAVATTAAALSGSDLSEGDVLAAVMLAQHAVAPWYPPDAAGGATLVVATLTADRLIAASVGDCAVLAGPPQGALTRLSPRPAAGPLREWIGQSRPLMPWLESWPISGPHVVAATSDGIDADGVPTGTSAADTITRMWAHGILRDRDDVSTSVAAVTWTGQEGGEPH